MTAFGDQPERDRIQLSSVESELYADLAASYGDFVDPDTAIRVNIEFKTEKFLDGTPVPAGYGQGNLEEIKAALAEARGDRADIIDSHNAWIELGDEMQATVRRAANDTKRLVLMVAVLAGLGGFAVGFGLAALLIGLVG